MVESCKICNSEIRLVFEKKVLFKHKVKYFYCPNCGFMQTEDPYWLEEAYNDAINIYDTGIMQRNIELSRQSALILFELFNFKGRFLDFAGGYGVFSRMMRDIGFDFYWSDKYSENLFVRGFEYDKLANVECVTAFEVFEHLVDPISEIGDILNISNNLLFSTKLLPKIPQRDDEWWYYGFEHGQHISFYSYETLQYIVDKYNVCFYQIADSLFLYADKKISPNRIKHIFNKNMNKKIEIITRKLGTKTISDMNLLKEKMKK